MWALVKTSPPHCCGVGCRSAVLLIDDDVPVGTCKVGGIKTGRQGQTAELGAGPWSCAGGTCRRTRCGASSRGQGFKEQRTSSSTAAPADPVAPTTPHCDPHTGTHSDTDPTSHVGLGLSPTSEPGSLGWPGPLQTPRPVVPRKVRLSWPEAMAVREPSLRLAATSTWGWGGRQGGGRSGWSSGSQASQRAFG